jgi:hypothetical protein
MRMTVSPNSYLGYDEESSWLIHILGWKHPIQPRGAEDKGYEYDVLEAVQDEPVSQLIVQKIFRAAF